MSKEQEANGQNSQESEGGIISAFINVIKKLLSK